MNYRDIIEIIIAFFIAWAFYQSLIFATGTNLPIVSVVSDSMDHNGNFNEWWAENREFYEDIEDIDIYDYDEFHFEDKYDEFQESFIEEFETNFSNPRARYYFTEEEIEKNSVIHFNYNITNINEHHNHFNKYGMCNNIFTIST